MRKLKATLLGAGNRGQIYCDYALTCPEELEIVSVIDINPFKMNEAGDKYCVKNEMRFLSLDEFIKANVECDFVVNATMDEMHYETSMKLIEAGYNLILEKPITANLNELLDIERLAKEKGVKILVCHVLRYTPFYRTIKKIIDSGKIGKVINMQLNEHVWYGHFVNSYVRGKWRSEKACGSGLLLAKCCHDTDLICWLNNISEPKNISSFGSKSFFTESNAPEGATKYCYQCPQKGNCMFNAYKFQIEKDFIPFYTWAELNKPLEEITLDEKVEFLKKDNMAVHAAVAQEESMSKSRSIRWGLVYGFQSGMSKLANRICYGYEQDKDGKLIINEEEAKNVKLIFELYLQRYSLSGISKELKRRRILSPTGKETWTGAAIDKILGNEKYIGQALLQKTHIPDVLEQKQKKNKGELAQYLYENNHRGIIDSAMFEAVQAERARRSNVVLDERGKEIRKSTRHSSGHSLSGKIRCGECGRNFRRITTHSGEIVWRCAGRVEKNGTCKARAVKQSEIDERLKDNEVREIMVLKDELILLK